MISYKQKKQKDPTDEDIKFILKLFNSNKFIKAKQEIEKKIINYSNSPILHNILGAVLTKQNHLQEAIESYKKALLINPNYAQAYNNLGTAFQKLNKSEEAIFNYKKAISIKNNFAEAYNNLGGIIYECNKIKDSLDYFKQAVKIKTDFSEAYNNLGLAYQDLGNSKEALENFYKAIKIKPDFVEAYNSIGLVFNTLANFDEATKNYNKAIEINPNYEKPYNNLGSLLSNLGNYDEATITYKKAIKIKSDYAMAYSNLLFNLNYKQNLDLNLYLSVAKDFRLNCKTIKKKLNFKYQYDKNPKKLRIGLVSADFGNHPGGFFSLSTLRELQKKNFDFIAYATTNRKDELSRHFKPLFLKWHLVEKKKDEEIVEQIFKDKVHILMDLQGHSAKNRLTIFFYKPAPIQATWLGQGSTGIPEIDYFIGSPHITPSNEEKYYVEKIFRLPEISQSFTEPEFDLKVNELPALKNNFITFGSINKLNKINDEVISLWSKVLLSISNSKLLLRNKNFADKKVTENMFKRFEKQNINRKRLIFLGGSKTRKEILETYNEIDIALDTFPFQGNTTTCEAVWMGVPVLTLKGNRYLFHFGESINVNLDMKEWIAENYQEYISKAVKFTSNLEQLSKIRKNLRKIALNSPVFDAPRFADHFSNMLWKIWKKFKNEN